MKLFKTSLFALTILAGTISTFAQTADEIIQKHLTAAGGRDSWKKVNSIRMEGKMNANGMEIEVVKTVLNKKGMRQDITLMGMTGYMILTPNEGWSFMPFGGGQTKAEPLTADQVKEMQDELDVYNELVDYKENGSKVDYIGKDDIEGTEVYKIKLVNKGGKEKTMFIDCKNYYLIREAEKVKADGKEMEMAVDFSNFKKQDIGIVFPMTVGTPQGEVTFSKLDINTTIDESIFKPAN